MERKDAAFGVKRTATGYRPPNSASHHSWDDQQGQYRARQRMAERLTALTDRTETPCVALRKRDNAVPLKCRRRPNRTGEEPKVPSMLLDFMNEICGIKSNSRKSKIRIIKKLRRPPYSQKIIFIPNDGWTAVAKPHQSCHHENGGYWKHQHHRPAQMING